MQKERPGCIQHPRHESDTAQDQVHTAMQQCAEGEQQLWGGQSSRVADVYVGGCEA